MSEYIKTIKDNPKTQRHRSIFFKKCIQITHIEHNVKLNKKH